MLHATLRRATKKGWVERKAAEDADRVTLKPSGDFNVLSAEDADALVRAARDDSEAALHRVAVGPGLRMGRSVPFAGGTWTSGGARYRSAGLRPGISIVPSPRACLAAARRPVPRALEGLARRSASPRRATSFSAPSSASPLQPMASAGVSTRPSTPRDSGTCVRKRIQWCSTTCATRSAPSPSAWRRSPTSRPGWAMRRCTRRGSTCIRPAARRGRPAHASSRRRRRRRGRPRCQLTASGPRARAPFRPRFTGGTGWLPLGPVLEPNPGASVFPTTRAPMFGQGHLDGGAGGWELFGWDRQGRDRAAAPSGVDNRIIDGLFI